VSDDLVNGAELSPDERETSLSDMITIVLNSLL
jgi:purine-nucleoside phosphorylase